MFKRRLSDRGFFDSLGLRIYCIVILPIFLVLIWILHRLSKGKISPSFTFCGFETFSSSLVIFGKRAWKLLSHYQGNDLLSVKYFCLKGLDWVSN